MVLANIGAKEIFSPKRFHLEVSLLIPTKYPCIYVRGDKFVYRGTVNGKRIDKKPLQARTLKEAVSEAFGLLGKLETSISSDPTISK